MFIYVIVALLAAVVTYLCTPVVRLVALRNGIMSPLRDRDIHTVMMPRLGGVALYIGFVVALVVASQTFWVRAIFRDTSVPWGILAGATVVLLVGVVDDVFDLNSFVKLGGQIAGALVVALWGPRLTVLPVGPTHIASEPLQVLLTVFIIVLTMNAINFVDGLDGLAAGIGMIAAAATGLFSIGLVQRVGNDPAAYSPALIAAVLAGACLGFLPHNFNPARIFMGDSGSMLIGLLLAAATTSASGKIALYGANGTDVLALFAPLVVLAAVVAVPLLDLLMAVVRRTRKGMSPFSPDKMHLHHRLLEIGHSQRRAVLLIYLWAGVLAFGAVALALIDDPFIVLWAVGIGLVVAVLATAIPRVRSR
jgi:UDP-GlcNAc:undecaprenyl-phosphate GlcNAc-1-phosphate transferase